MAQFLANATGQNVFDDATPENIQALMSQVWPAPTGAVLPFAGTVAPTGFLMCNTATPVSRTTYAALFAVIGTSYGVGDGSTTFGIPNMSGVFPRGTGTQTISGIATSTVVIGAVVGDQIQGHYHASIAGASIEFNGASGNTLGAAAGASAQFGDPVGSPSSDGINGTPRVGLETYPANIGINYIIKT